MSNTIFAQCSAPGKAGVAIFRVSGPNALDSLSKLITHDYSQLEPKKIYLRKIYTSNKQKVIDEAMVVYFKDGASFTGEDTVEIYTHGSISVAKLLNETLAAMDDVRLAERGEFAKRAFLNGKMDLTSAEGLADLIDAETEMQHTQAIQQFSGSLQKTYEEWRLKIMKIISLLEAYIDFPDEDIPENIIQSTQQEINKLTQGIKDHLNDNHRGERLRNGIKLAIIGPPNAGKSSLTNLLMRRNLSIVSNIAGTTRDIIEGYIDINGYPLILQDTAGININSEDEIEQEGIERALQAARFSEIKIIMRDASIEDKLPLKVQEIIDKYTIILHNKIDLIDNISQDNSAHHINISVKENIGIDQLYKKITELCQELAAPSNSPQITRARHRGQLERALNSLENFSLQNDLVLATEDLRMTARSISNITGKITVDEILGEIFSSFCIGK